MKNAYFAWIVFFAFGAISQITSADQSSTPNTPAKTNSVEEIQGIQFLNSDIFDRQLSRALSSKEPTVKVTFPIAFTTNEIPERIDKWLVAVEDYGGTIDVQPEQIERGLLDNLVASFIKGVYEKIKEKLMYIPAKNYNATVYYEPRTGNVTRVMFLKKSS